MKLVLLLIFFTPLITPQEKQGIKNSVKIFFETVKNYTNEFNSSNTEELLKTKQYTDKELESLLYKYYNAMAEDPVGFEKYQKIEDALNRNLLIKSMGKDLSIARKVGIIYRILSSKYSRSFVDIISRPYYLKVKIMDIQQKQYETDKGPVPRTILFAQIEDVVKGNNLFNKGDKIEINYLNWWMSNAPGEFIKGKKYFIAFRPWSCYLGNCDKYAVSMFSDGNHGIYSIDENDNIFLPDDFFRVGEKLYWLKFKKQFENKYVLNEAKNE